MNKLFSYFKRAPKRVGAFLVVLFALLALPINSVMAVDALLEGSIGVANQTTGETTYKPSTSAKYDEVVKFSVYYHNRELPDSNRVANDVKIKINFPTAAGTNQVVKATIAGTNTNTVTDTASVTLNRSDARLEFIPGSTYWKHNTGSRSNPTIVTTHIADSVILNGAVIEDVKPCHEYEATVTFMARVKIPSVSITKQVRVAGGSATTNLSAQPNARVEYLITVKNLGNETLTNVKVHDALPANLTFVPGTVKLYNGANPNGVVINNDLLFHGGVNGGSVGPGATIYYTFSADVAGVTKLQCGLNTLKNIAVVDTDQTGEYNNNATVTVTKECQTTSPTYRCDALNVTKLGGRSISLGVQYTATNGATLKNVTYEFGDGSAPLLTNKTSGVEHTYAKDGEYTQRATVRFNVNGAEQTSVCEAKVTFTGGTPTTLVNTGAGDVFGIFAAVSVAGAIAHKFVLARRLS